MDELLLQLKDICFHCMLQDFEIKLKIKECDARVWPGRNWHDWMHLNNIEERTQDEERTYLELGDT